MAVNTTTPSILGMKTMRGVIAHTSHNIANADTDGFKSALDVLYDIEGDNGVSSIEKYAISVKGAINYTGISTDLAIDNGQGMFAVIDKNDPTKTIYYMPTGSFRTNKDSQLEYLNAYLLLGQEYDMNTGVLIGGQGNALAFKPVAFGLDKTTAKAVASTEIDAAFKLKADALVSGQPQVLIEPANNGTTRQNLGPNNTPLKLDDILAPDMAAWSYNAGLVLGSGFNVAVRRMDGTQVITQNISCELGGITYTERMSSSGTTVPNTTTDTLDIKYGEATLSIKASEIYGSNDKVALQNLSTKLNNIGFRSRLITDTADPNTASFVSLLISPPSSDMSLSFSGSLASILGLAGQSLEAAQGGNHRFSSMSDLTQLLTPGFDSIITNSNSANILLNGKLNNSISMTNNQTQDILSALGLPNNGTEFNSGYDPYNSDRNIAGGAFTADIVQTVDVFDSEGYSHPINIGLKKISTNTWSMEVYVADKTSISSSTRIDGLLQASILTFNTDGSLSGVAPFERATYSVGTRITDPFVNLNANNGQDITINGTTFTYLTTGTLGTNQFRSMIDLVNSINNNTGLQSQLTASVIKDKRNMYQLKLTPLGKNTITVSSTNAGIIQPPLGDGATNQTITAALGGMQPVAGVPDIASNLNIKWAPTFGSADSSIKVNYDATAFYQAVQPMSGDVTANGRAVGQLTGIEIEQNGDVIGNYTNGVGIKLYRLPIGTFKNMNGLNPRGDNSYAQSSESGQVNFVSPGDNSAVTISSGKIESSNVDIGEQLTRMMIANQTYGACTKTLQVGLRLIDVLMERV